MTLPCGHSAHALIIQANNQYACSACIVAEKVEKELAARYHGPDYSDRGIRCFSKDKEPTPNVCHNMDRCECALTGYNCTGCARRSYRNCLCVDGQRFSRRKVLGDFFIAKQTKGKVTRWYVLDTLEYAWHGTYLEYYEASSHKLCAAWIEHRCPTALRYVTMEPVKPPVIVCVMVTAASAK